ncbi:hypothetical protein Fmac_007079 [Flemingia macrophylla]|uniref:Uncharacterized protein n=1 Tax=Flemingia macrophylla TaxID=520843 RepID=A0ABD1NCG2_9FABA
MTLLIASAIRVQTVENSNVQIQASVAALINDPHSSLGSGAAVGDPQALTASGLPARPNRPTESGPSILAAPGVRLGSVPGGAISAHGVQVPPV